MEKIRLIDDTTLVHNLHDKFGDDLPKGLLSTVILQPTAYDKNKVLEKMDEIRKEIVSSNQYEYSKLDMLYYVNKLIVAVRDGGVK